MVHNITYHFVMSEGAHLQFQGKKKTHLKPNEEEKEDDDPKDEEAKKAGKKGGAQC